MENSPPELIRVLGGLESSVTNLSKGFDDFREDLKDINSTCQSFREYKENNKDIPKQVSELQRIAEDYIKNKEIRDKESILIRSMNRRHEAVITAAAVLNTIALIFVWMLSKGYVRLDLI